MSRTCGKYNDVKVRNLQTIHFTVRSTKQPNINSSIHIQAVLRERESVSGSGRVSKSSRKINSLTYFIA